MAAKRWFLVLALAGCSLHAATGPAWPKQHEAEKDGGESIAPHAAARSVAAVEKSGGGDDDQPAAKPTVTPTAPAAGSAAPVGTAPTMIQEETPVTTEDIIIEIDD